MARPRSFDEDTVIDAAMLAFWRTGYDDTPVGALETATGVKRISLYNTFGDKEGLFLAALDRYHLGASDVYEGMVAQGGLDEIQKLFSAMSAAADKDAPANSGCLMVNTVLDVRRASDAVKEKIVGYRAMIRGAFVSALKNAQAAGQMEADDALIEARATYLLGLLWGALAMIRVDGQTTAAKDVADVGNAVIDGWRTR
ncbi:TetR/AcrR family transcriptional regulator [Litoreibacter roseus]|uniref:TetR family transcriptional regulator n=1 Tax=Litoreibacter roseus TaxID=2601869 RepID=A0A6N6JJU4_9RHOB|nr:TetR/AcrR family transcriptional regulator [Litoreibacter roseus]GFE65709.1 TetR family transcriptional regulator [Litoreibacter roseus]